MDSKYFQKCFFIFYLLGQNSYDLRANRASAWLQHIPRTFFIFLSAGIICWQSFFGGSSQKPGPLVVIMILTMVFTINALVFLEYFLVPNGVRKLSFAYKQAIVCLEQKLYIKIDYERFRRAFRCNLHIIFWAFLLTLALKVIFALYGNASINEFIFSFLYYLKHFAIMHILFHVEFVHFLLQTINTEFDPIINMFNANRKDFEIESTTKSKTNELLVMLRNCKCAHFRIWKISQILNVRFGWILIALMLATLLDISYSTYWIWIFTHKSFHEHIPIHRFMRKYSFFFVIDCRT